MPPKSKPEKPERAAPAPLRAAPYVSEPDFADALYRPHTVAALASLLALLAWQWARAPAEGDLVTNVKLGATAAACAFVGFGAVHLPDGLLVRPHPALWRAVLAVGVLYLMALVFALFQDLATVRAIFGHYDPALRRPLPEQSYAEDCRLSTPEEPLKFWHTVADVFLLAHSLGYWAKMLVLRDWRLATCVSVGFELIEVSLQHVLPNFKECWWDHLIVDVLICNAGGTLLGALTLRLLGAKQYDWVPLGKIATLRGKASRVLRQFAPRTLERYRWALFDSPRRLGQVALLLLVLFVQEVNCFTLKSLLRQPPHHHLVVARLALWGVLALPAVREYHEFVSGASRRIGTTAWVGLAALTAETLLVAKLAREAGSFREPTPSYVALPWLAVCAVLAAWFALRYGAPGLRRRLLGRWLLRLHWVVVAALLAAMCAMGNVDLQWGRAEFEAFVAERGLW